MNWGFAGILIVFGAFVLLMIFRPNLSCFGKRLKSPFYPLYRKRKIGQAQKSKKIKTEDYGFHLSNDGAPASAKPKTPAQKKTEDYRFKLD